MQKVELKLAGMLEVIPPANDDTFKEWCEERDFVFLDSPRRAWCDSLRTYIRDADYLFHVSGETLLIKHEEILKGSVVVFDKEDFDIKTSARPILEDIVCH